jgi:hypothetical protein
MVQTIPAKEMKMNNDTDNTFAKSNPVLSRRRALSLLAAASAGSISASAAPAAIAASDPSPRSGSAIEENPELLEVYERFLTALDQEKEARDAVEWIADEWRHLWPLAPEEILDSANAHLSGRGGNNPEVDIAGRCVMRNTADLTKRFSAKFSRLDEKTCFNIFSSERARGVIALWENHTPKGRTEKALARNRADKEYVIKEYRRKFTLAQKYEADTASIRAASGMDKAKAKLADAISDVAAARAEISNIPAFTTLGIRIKAAALASTGLFGADWSALGGPLGEMARLLKSVLEVTRSETRSYVGQEERA